MAILHFNNNVFHTGDMSWNNYIGLIKLSILFFSGYLMKHGEMT